MKTDRRGRPGRGERADRRNERPGRPRGGERRGEDLLYGRNAVLEALRGRRQSGRLLIAEGVRDDERILALRESAATKEIPIDHPPKALLDELTRGANHQGVALEASTYPYVSLDELEAATGTVLVLDHLQDPQNVGTLLRAAEAAGVAGVIMANNRAVEVTPAVVNASAGAVEHLRITQVANLAHMTDTLKELGWWIVGLHTGPEVADLYATDLPSPVALIVGAEGTGLSQLLRQRCDLLVALPMLGKVASLNAATAGAIALFDIVRRQRDDAHL